MTFTEAAAEVLRQVGRPLHYKEITAYAIEKSLLSHVGKSPEVTMGARLAALFKKPAEENPLVRVKPGVFALREWEESGQLKDMVVKTKPTARTVTAPEKPIEEPEPPKAESVEKPVEEPKPEPELPKIKPTRAPIRRRAKIIEAKTESETTPVEPAKDELKEQEPTKDSETVEPVVEATEPEPRQSSDPPISEPEPEPRVEPASDQNVQTTAAQATSAQATSVQATSALATSVQTTAVQEARNNEQQVGTPPVFEEEDDDDLPIFSSQDANQENNDRDSSRRRRRRRRRPKGSEVNGVAYSASPLSAGEARNGTSEARGASTTTAAGPHPVVLEVTSSPIEHFAMDDLGGKDMADSIASALAASDRAAGPLSLRQLAETTQRKGRLAGDAQLFQSQIAASVRADNLRRIAAGQRPRFRFVAGRVALTDWLLNGELTRHEQEAIAAVERYREASRKVFVRKLQELPGHAFIELALLLLERIGFHNVRAMRRAGISGQEAHFTASLDTGAGYLHAALAIRRDGREIGRERVAEMRGACHHYGPASVGWLITAGSVLSGAREEAASTNSTPIVLFDGFGIARLCEQHDIAVVRTTLPICIPDLDVLEALRSS